jgi:hypothetical protein
MQFEDNKTLSDYKIVRGSTMNSTMRLRGGTYLARLGFDHLKLASKNIFELLLPNHPDGKTILR